MIGERMTLIDGRAWKCDQCGDGVYCYLIYDFSRVKPSYCPVDGEDNEPCWECLD